MKMTCPSCRHEWNGSLAAIVAPEQRLTLTLRKEAGQEDELFTADTISGALSGLVDALNAAAKSLGGKVAVFVTGITYKPGMVRVDVMTVEGKKKESKKR